MAPPLELDFDRAALNGVELGDPIEGLSFLGAADDDRFAEAHVRRHRPLGLEFGEANGCLAELTLFWADRFGFEFQPFAGTCRRGSSVLRLGPTTREAEIVEFFGKPGARSSTRDVTLLSYFSPRAKWEVRLGPGGALQEIRISEEPFEEPDAPWPIGCAGVALMALMLWVGFQDGCPGYHARNARSRMRAGAVWTEAFLVAEGVVSPSYLLRASCATRKGGSLMFARVPGKRGPRYTIVDQEGSQSYPDRAAWGAAIKDALREPPCGTLKIGVDHEDAFVTVLDDVGRIRSVSSIE